VNRNQKNIFFGILLFNFVYLILISILMYAFFLSGLNNLIHLKEELNYKNEATQEILKNLKQEFKTDNEQLKKYFDDEFKKLGNLKIFKKTLVKFI